MEPQTSPRLPGIDHVIGLSNCMDKAELFEKLLRMFVNAQGAIIDQVRQRLSQGDNETALRIAHTLKSNSATIGAVTLAAASAKLESALGRGNTAEAELTHAEQELHVVLSGIEAYFNHQARSLF